MDELHKLYRAIGGIRACTLPELQKLVDVRKSPRGNTTYYRVGRRLYKLGACARRVLRQLAMDVPSETVVDRDCTPCTPCARSPS